MTNITKLKIVDLFCGAGGWSLGLTKAGHKITTAIDNWQSAIDTYNFNFDHKVTKMDIMDLDSDDKRLHEADLIIGSPPCQTFSLLNKHRTNDLGLTSKFLELVKDKPFIMENVVTAKKKIENSGLMTNNMTAKTVSLWNYNVPQPRNRLILSNFLNIDEIPKSHRGLEYYYPKFDDISERERERDIPNHSQDIIENKIKLTKNGESFNKKFAVYHRLPFTGKSITITNVCRGVTLHPILNRRLTVFEGAILQTFPPSYIFQGIVTNIAIQVANAVPPAFSELIGNSLETQLKNYYM